jgi:hypothetical protein
MGRKTKYCVNYKRGKHLNDGKSPSHMYCSECYPEAKAKYEKKIDNIEAQGGRLVGLRAARTLAGGSFGYERSKEEKTTNLMAFFNYVMPEIDTERALQLSREIAEGSGKSEIQKQDGSYTTIKMY